MADAKTTYLSNAMLNAVLRNIAYTSPAAVYVGLVTAIADGNAASWTEVAGGSYARQAAAFGVPSGGLSSTTGDIAYPVASAPWGTVVGAFIADAVTAGNALYWGLLAVAKAVGLNDQFKFLAGNLSAQEQ